MSGSVVQTRPGSPGAEEKANRSLLLGLLLLVHLGSEQDGGRVHTVIIP